MRYLVQMLGHTSSSTQKSEHCSKVSTVTHFTYRETNSLQYSRQSLAKTAVAECLCDGTWLHPRCGCSTLVAKCSQSRDSIKTRRQRVSRKCSSSAPQCSRCGLTVQQNFTVSRHRSPFTFATIIISKLNVTPTRDTITNIFTVPHLVDCAAAGHERRWMPNGKLFASHKFANHSHRLQSIVDLNNLSLCIQPHFAHHPHIVYRLSHRVFMRMPTVFGGRWKFNFQWFIRFVCMRSAARDVDTYRSNGY